MEALEQYGAIPIDYAVLRSTFSEYKFPKNKIALLEQEGKLIRLKKGLYVVSPSVSKKLLSIELIANHLYGPSYVSMESALRYYGLIPEQVFTVRSATFNRSKQYKNSIAIFDYISVPAEYHPVGIRFATTNENCKFLIASPEKALCDMITTTPGLRIQSLRGLKAYLEEDIRFEMSALMNMNTEIIKQCIRNREEKGIVKISIKRIAGMNIFEQMLAKYDVKTGEQKKNAIHEVMQEITLAGLYRSRFFDKAAFYGGTCLKIFHELARFSEDMDFSLLAKDEKFDLESYFPAIIAEFKAAGRDVVITRKEKKRETKIESAFLKDDTAVYDVNFKTEKTIKIKIEVDIDPPLGFSTEQRLSLMPFSFMTRCFTLPDLFAGKMHALLFRNWKTRVKGRDWYDFEWYIRHDIPLNFNHLQVRTMKFNGMNLDKNDFAIKLNERLTSTDIHRVKRDVMPFIPNPKELDIWSNGYFLQLADRITYV